MTFKPMNGEDRLVVADEPVEFEKLHVEVQDFSKSPIILEEFVKYTPIQ
jgi:hypothetical protein